MIFITWVSVNDSVLSCVSMEVESLFAHTLTFGHLMHSHLPTYVATRFVYPIHLSIHHFLTLMHPLFHPLIQIYSPPYLSTKLYSGIVTSSRIQATELFGKNVAPRIYHNTAMLVYYTIHWSNIC